MVIIYTGKHEIDKILEEEIKRKYGNKLFRFYHRK